MATDGPSDPTQAFPPPEPPLPTPAAPEEAAEATTMLPAMDAGVPPGSGEPPSPGGGGPPGEGGGPDEPEEPSSSSRRNLAIALGVGILLLLLLLFFLLRDDSGEEVETADSTTTTETSTTTTASTTTTTSSTTTTSTSTTSTSTSTTTTAPAPADLVLSPSGLGVVSFAQGQASVVSTVSAALGAPTSEGPQTDCPAGNDYRIRWGSLFLDFRGGSFTGWEYRGGSPAMSTPEGITVGSTVGQAAGAFPGFSISETSLGPEFTSDFGGGTHISGIATDTADSGSITSMWGGDICIFR